MQGHRDNYVSYGYIDNVRAQFPIVVFRARISEMDTHIDCYSFGQLISCMLI